MGGVELMSVGEGGRGEGISLCVKFKTSGIFWWGYCSCCYRGKTKSTPSLKAEAWTLDWSLTKKHKLSFIDLSFIDITI